MSEKLIELHTKRSRLKALHLKKELKAEEVLEFGSKGTLSVELDLVDAEICLIKPIDTWTTEEQDRYGNKSYIRDMMTQLRDEKKHIREQQTAISVRANQGILIYNSRRF